MKIKERLLERGNDYSELEHITSQHGFELIFGNCTTVPRGLNETISVVLPCYNVRVILPKCLMSLESQVYHNFEVIAVNDGSKEDLDSCIKEAEITFDLHYIKNKENRDRSYARNVGINVASGNTVVVMDPDIIVNPYYLLNFAIRQSLLGSVVLVGFRQDIKSDDSRISEENIKSKKLEPDYRADWRYFRKYRIPEQAFNIWGHYEKEPRDFYPLKETNFLKDFGHGKLMGNWDLASLAHGHSICFKRKEGILAGGFDERFRGWGADDIAFGMRMIALGCFVVPVLSVVGYHVDHPPMSGSIELKKRDKIKTHDLLKESAEDEFSSIIFPGHSVMPIYKEKNKFYYAGDV